MTSEIIELPETGTLSLTEAQWAEARRRAAIIGPLADSGTVSQLAADRAGQQLELTGRSVYSLVEIWRRTGGNVAMLAPAQPSGGKGKSRTDAAVETVISTAIDKLYLTAQKPRISKVMGEVRRQCRLAGLKIPALNTVRDRVARVRPDKATQKREGSKAAHRLQPAAGATPEARAPLDVIQMDHTTLDIIIVDPVSHQPIGRPFLTIAIDGFSRCIVGICITLEAPSATSVGLCLAHAVTEKRPWLEKLGLDCTWPMRGKPKLIYVDNGRDFHSEALRRGCEVHGIKIDHRPVARPHYGGIVERIIGTMMRMLHELPGTTFSNIRDRGKYDSDAKAALTLAELEKWITLAICGVYHNEVHGTLLEPPAAKWLCGVAQFGAPIAAQNQQAFLIDFLPIIRRRIQRHGFVIDRVGYYANALSPWIAERDRLEKFAIRRDPRDLSRIWVLDPKRNIYIEVPYRTISNPAVTEWEQRAATKRLRDEGRAKVDEAAIFNAVEQMRTIADEAATKSRAARRGNVRRAHLPDQPPAPVLPDMAPACDAPVAVAQPFADIEEW